MYDDFFENTEVFTKPSTSTSAQKKKTRLLAVTSGKGGVGKSNIALNLAIALAQKNHAVAILDADLGLGNLDTLLGLVPKYNLSHVINGKKSLNDVLLTGPSGIKILPGGSGVADLANMAPEAQKNFISQFQSLDSQLDYVIIDTAPGISNIVTSFVTAAPEILPLQNSTKQSLTVSSSMSAKKQANPSDT